MTDFNEGDRVTPRRFIKYYTGNALLPGEVFYILEIRGSTGIRMRVRCAASGVDAWQNPEDFAIVGQGDAQPAPAVATPAPVADAETKPSPFAFYRVTDCGDAVRVKYYDDGSLYLAVGIHSAALDANQTRELRAHFNSAEPV